jgi:hypothetical protein
MARKQTLEILDKTVRSVIHQPDLVIAKSSMAKVGDGLIRLITVCKNGY